ncbi:MAG: hypothetical protein HRU19_21825 [Pseudobacteriovorax sp.]|nr:hypothetical protein [Pseudobacteriovorax sp.]
MVSRSSKAKELAYLFCLFACSPDISTKAVSKVSGYFDPFREEHYKEAAIQQTYGSGFLEAHRQSMKQAIPDLYLIGQAEYMNSLQQALILIMKGQVDPKFILRKLKSKWNALSSSKGLEKQKQQWIYLQSHYPELIRSKLDWSKKG